MRGLRLIIRQLLTFHKSVMFVLKGENMNRIDKIKKDLNLCFDYSKLDFNKPVTREHIDWEVYNNKFKFVDRVKAMKNPNPLYLKVIDDDKTMKTYYFLRLNNEPLKLYPYQDLIINDDYMFIYFEASNQIGKSITLDVDADLDFIEDHGKEFNIVIISKTLPQSTHQMRRIKQFLNSMSVMDWKEDKGTSDNMSVIELDWKDESRKDADGNPKIKYTNRVICVPATEAALGYDVHKMYLDEFEFWDDAEYTHDQILEPRTFTTNGGMTFTTNPNGDKSKGAELIKLRLPDGNKKFHVYNFDFLDRPGATKEMLEIRKIGKSRSVIESTLLAIRSKTEKSYFTRDEIECSYDENEDITKMVGKHPIFFLDVGAIHDQSSLHGGYVELKEGFDAGKKYELNKPFIEFHMPIIHLYPVGYPLSRVVGSFDDSHASDGWHHEKSVDEHLTEWTTDGVNPTFGYDITGNQGMKPLFASIGRGGAIDITFSGPVKSGMYQRYKYIMEMKLLKRIKHKEWEHQAATLEAKKGVRGYLLINSDKTGSGAAAKKKKIPDDTQDGTVGFIQLADNPNRVAVSATVVIPSKPKEEDGKPKTEGSSAAENHIAKTVLANNSWNRPRSPYG